MILACFNQEIVDNEIPSRRMRALWLALLLENTVFLVFSGFSREIATTSLFIYEIILAVLNVMSFVAVLNYRKATLKTINSEIQDELLAAKGTPDDETQISNENLSDNISSVDIVNKFLDYYEAEQRNTEKIRRNQSASFSSDDENADFDYKLMKNRSQVP